MLGPAIFSIPVGNLNNRYGSKPLVCTGMVIILAGILFMTQAQSFPTLIASRLIQGLGFALVWTPSQTLSAKWFTRDEISTASGGYITALSLAFGVAALLTGGPLADKIGRRHHQVRICALILGLIMFGLGFFLHDPVSRKKS